MTKHTRGPWFEKYGSQIYTDTALNPELNIATANRMGTRSEQEANARLIAAAPELLEALKSALTVLPDSVGDFDRDKAEAAIAKATGENV